MKGFIEVTLGDTPITISIDSILRIVPENQYTECKIITKEVVSHFECSNSNNCLIIEETYEQVKQLIEEAQ